MQRIGLNMGIGTLENKREKKIIVSLTSFPARIANVHKTIKTLLIQNMQPDMIILWLAEEEFPEKCLNLPKELLELQRYGLIIRWCEDLKPHKKYYYSMREFPDDVIITVDDDVYYSPSLIESLYNSYLRFPNAVSCMRANLMIRSNNGELASYNDWVKNYKRYKNREAMDLMAVGIGGVLYPPYSLNNEVFNIDSIRRLCLLQDDLWLKAMEVKNNIPTVLVEGNTTQEIIEGTQDNALFTSVNYKYNDRALKAIWDEYNYINENESLNSRIFESEGKAVNLYLKERKLLQARLKEEILKCNRIIIYGAGLGARYTYKCLKSIMPSILIHRFAVSSIEDNPETLYDVPVVNIRNATDDVNGSLVIVSTAEKSQPQIRKLLNQLGFTKIIYVIDDMMGPYISSHVIIDDIHESFLSNCIIES